jgi:hypothetical protein
MGPGRKGTRAHSFARREIEAVWSEPWSPSAAPESSAGRAWASSRRRRHKQALGSLTLEARVRGTPPVGMSNEASIRSTCCCRAAHRVATPSSENRALRGGDKARRRTAAARGPAATAGRGIARALAAAAAAKEPSRMLRSARRRARIGRNRSERLVDRRRQGLDQERLRRDVRQTPEPWRRWCARAEHGDTSQATGWQTHRHECTGGSCTQGQTARAKKSTYVSSAQRRRMKR